MISTEDFLARVERLNRSNEGWTRSSWWDNKMVETYVACGSCKEDENFSYDEGVPELCRCVDGPKIEGTNNEDIGGMLKTTWQFVKRRRRELWVENFGWNEDRDIDRRVFSTEVNTEDLQDYQVPMVIIGTDIISLYPNMK